MWRKMGGLDLEGMFFVLALTFVLLLSLKQSFYMCLSQCCSPPSSVYVALSHKQHIGGSVVSAIS